MKCGRLRFSNCFVVFFPFLSSSPRSRFFVQLDPFLPFLSFHRSRTLQRISTCTIPRLSSVLSSSSFTSSSFFFFFFPIPIPPFLISSFLPRGILLPSLRLPHLLASFFVSFLCASLLIIRSIHAILSFYLAFSRSLTSWFMNVLRIFSWKFLFFI